MLSGEGYSVLTSYLQLCLDFDLDQPVSDAALYIIRNIEITYHTHPTKHSTSRPKVISYF